MGDLDKLERFPSSHNARQQVMGFGAFGSNAACGHGWLCAGLNTGSGMQRQVGGKSASHQFSRFGATGSVQAG